MKFTNTDRVRIYNWNNVFWQVAQFADWLATGPLTPIIFNQIFPIKDNIRHEQNK